jgi:hypothetical protein
MSITSLSERMLQFVSDEDLAGFSAMKSSLGSQDWKYARSRKTIVFNEMLRVILGFCCRSLNDQWKRYLACGICPFGENLAVNTCALAALMNRSKSCVNATLVELGFEPISATAKQLQELGDILHISSLLELRRWTIRRRSCDKGPEAKINPEEEMWQFPEDDWSLGEPWA